MIKKPKLDSIREDFPLLDQKTYLDNAATSLSPKPVLNTFVEYNEKYRANIGRGVHHLSKMASHKYRQAHRKVANFIGAQEDEIIFLKNTTEAVNIVSRGLEWEKNDHVIVSKMEHHSNLLPWIRLEKEKEINLEFVDIRKDGSIDIEELENKVDKNTKLVSISHASNVLGTINQIQKVGEICDKIGTYFLVDAAQTISHSPIDVKEINCDFLCFSGHKALAPTGTGALYVKNKIQGELAPLVVGGGMVEDVSLQDFSVKEGYDTYEAGTPNIGGGIAFGEAVDYLSDIGMKKIENHITELKDYLVRELIEISDIEVLYPNSKRIGVIPFHNRNVSSHKVAALLDQEDIILRSGEHCSQPLLKKLGYNGLLRASLLFYNSKEDIDNLIRAIRKY
ncbi:cysteine desulfurase [archaeon SCG-AAA382B04]|nr:cysteine desulfurase [archaeon SCG-AAA382B04]